MSASQEYKYVIYETNFYASLFFFVKILKPDTRENQFTRPLL